MPAHRIASRDSYQRHRAAADESIFRNRIASVHRATRFEAAGRPIHRMDKRRDRGTINRNRTERHESWRRFYSIDWIGKRDQLRSAPLAEIFLAEIFLQVIRSISLCAAADTSSAIESAA